MKLYKLDDISLAWSQSHLKKHSQRVAIKEVLCTSQTLTSGVPQGSILGPLLVLLHVNNLSFSICRADEILYADDTTMAKGSKYIQEIEPAPCHDVQNVSNWCEKIDIFLSVPKSNNIVIISTKQRFCQSMDGTVLNITTNNNTMPCVTSTNILGVLFDNTVLEGSD